MPDASLTLSQYGQRPSLPQRRPIGLHLNFLRLSVPPVSQLHQFTSPFSAYVALETPSTTFLRTLRPSRFIPGATILWGAVVVGSGFSRNYATQVAVRVLRRHGIGSQPVSLPVDDHVLQTQRDGQSEQLSVRGCTVEWYLRRPGGEFAMNGILPQI